MASRLWQSIWKVYFKNSPAEDAEISAQRVLNSQLNSSGHESDTLTIEPSGRGSSMHICGNGVQGEGLFHILNFIFR